MAIRSLLPAERRAYFEQVSRTLGAQRARVEIFGLGVGAQTVLDNIHLTGLSYDPRTDELEIFTDEIGHHIAQPREVYVDDDVEGLHSLEIVDDNGNKQILRLKRPLTLPASGQA